MKKYDPLGKPNGARQKSISKLKEHLLERRNELWSMLNVDAASNDEPISTLQGDLVDVTVTSARMEQSFGKVQSMTQELAKVEKAMSKIERHTYGRCATCREMIPIARLRVLPLAEKCVICQSAAEKASVHPRNLNVQYETMSGVAAI